MNKPMSDRSGTRLPMFDSLAAEFKTKLTATVEKIFPKLVTAELAKLHQPKRKLRKSADVAKDARKLRAKGLSQGQIAERLGVKQPYISVLLKDGKARTGDTSHSKSRKSSVKPTSVLQKALIKSNGNKRAAAKSLGIAESTFRDRLRAEGNAK